MTILWNLLATVAMKFLTSDDFIALVVGKLGQYAADDASAVNAEYVETAAKSLKERVIYNLAPSDGNVILEQAEIERIKKAHRNKYHEQV